MRLTVDHVTAGYGQTTALRDVTLIVPDGCVVALLGPNGAGKTTLLSVISGLVSARSGTITIDGEDIENDSVDRRVQRGVCHITEGRSVFPGLTVAENLRMFSPPGDEVASTERAISAFPKLGQRLQQIAGTMSGGEQQMLALARAYASQAPMVLLDEVSMGLAPIVVDEIFEFLRRIAAEGTSLLLVEQYVAKALALADHVYLLARGRIVYAGEPSQLEGDDLFAHYLGTESGRRTA